MLKRSRDGPDDPTRSRARGDIRRGVAWAPPGGGYHGALNHAVIHGLDVTVPLGLLGCQSDEAMRIVLDDLTAGGVHAHFGTTIDGRRYEATDLQWSYGSGEVARGTAAEIASAICGRRLPSGHAFVG